MHFIDIFLEIHEAIQAWQVMRGTCQPKKTLQFTNALISPMIFINVFGSLTLNSGRIEELRKNGL